MTRTAYGRDEIYTRFAWESLEDWRWLSSRASPPIFHPSASCSSFRASNRMSSDSIEVHKRLGIPLETLDRAALTKRFPQIVWDGVEIGLYESDRGALMARRAVQTLVQEFVAAGGEYQQLAVTPPQAAGALKAVTTLSGETLTAEQFVFACGPWLPKVFPEVLGGRIFRRARRCSSSLLQPATRASGRTAAGLGRLQRGRYLLRYSGSGSPRLQDRARPPRPADRSRYRRSRSRPPARSPTSRLHATALSRAGRRPLVEARVCQYENSSNGDLLIDRHPPWSNVLLVGAGSGHGFKHGPAVGRYAARLLSGQNVKVEPRFSLQSKAKQQQRECTELRKWLVVGG